MDSVFDQNKIKYSKHILNVIEEDLPAEFRHVIRRLTQATESMEVTEQMKAEDEILSDFKNLERIIEAQDEYIEKQDKKLKEQDMNLLNTAQ